VEAIPFYEVRIFRKLGAQEKAEGSQGFRRVRKKHFVYALPEDFESIYGIYL
jgi:hypothetical protein